MMQSLLFTQFSNKKIGIWGFGIVGKSVLKFLAKRTNSFIEIIEKRNLKIDEIELINQYNAHIISYEFINDFLENNDIIIPSPGIDLTNYHNYQHKFISELDIFAQFNTTKTIAISGSVGKTSITNILTQILQKLHVNVCAAGNIGIGMLDTINNSLQYDWIILELSSFQLEQSHYFAPNIGIITTIFNNHLDRHITLKSYINAKANMFRYQKEEDFAILPQSCFSLFNDAIQKQRRRIIKDDLYIDIKHSLSDITFFSNWQIILTALEIMGYKINNILPHISSLKSIEHRVEYCGKINEALFYNDSKSTIPEATKEAISKFPHQNIILFIGGMSKGIDRSQFIKDLSYCKNIKHILLFGSEAQTLSKIAKTTNTAWSMHKTLEESFQQCLQLICQNDIVLFSPSGSSYDLFENFEMRGKKFKELVEKYKK